MILRVLLSSRKICAVLAKVIDEVTLSGILKGKQKLGVTFNFDKGPSI